MSKIDLAILFSEILKLSLEQKEELQIILKEHLIEEKRELIYKNYQLTQIEEKDKNYQFSADLNKLKEIIEEK